MSARAVSENSVCELLERGSCGFVVFGVTGCCGTRVVVAVQFSALCTFQLVYRLPRLHL